MLIFGNKTSNIYKWTHLEGEKKHSCIPYSAQKKKKKPKKQKQKTFQLGTLAETHKYATHCSDYTSAWTSLPPAANSLFAPLLFD